MRARGGELSASMAVLGLVIDQPDSVSGVSRRLADRFPHARFARNSAHNNLPSLHRQGLVRLIAEGEQRSLDRYEATQKGRDRFRQSLRESSVAVPAVRDAMRARLEHVSDEADLLAVIAAIGEQEQACRAEYAAAHGRLRAAERARRAPGASAGDWRDAVRRALMVDEAVLWGTRAQRMQRLRESLRAEADPELGQDRGDV